MTIVLSLAIIFFIVIGLPLGFAIILSSFLALWYDGGISLYIIPQRIFAGIDSFSLLAIPFFLLAGSLMTAGGLSDRIINFANALVGRFKGGLAISNVITSIFFGGISGSSVADTSAIGGTFIPAMKRLGYTSEYSVAVTIASSPLSPLIPPSIAWIVYSFLTDTSIIRLFIAGIIPGLLWALGLIAMIIWTARRNNFPTHDKVSFKELTKSFGKALTSLLMPLIVLAGILSGVFTVTEASAFAVVYALFVGTIIHRELSITKIIGSLKDSFSTTAVVMLILGSANLFGWILAYANITDIVGAWVSGISENPLVFLLMVNFVLLILGSFMEVNAAKVMLVPVLFPTAIALGVDPVHFGVIVTANLCLGLITPPIGLCLALGCRIGEIPLEAGAKAVFPLFLVSLIVILLLTIFPQLSLWLPNLLLN
ncbi:TRAP transporter large permease [Halomonas sp. QX-2]|uniref:TRAP transporter large permease protein n=1 Tax=Vreelandella sedimenti TaxID=2729618 RepID=A0A7Z0N981_9GAMM|nr:TRAP transporter large permease [Halomonas sedimenti]NYT73743.1 TRAP transporter large permease [Halomonas sedimenti]